MSLSKRFKPDEVHKVYKKVPWSEITDGDVLNFIDLWCQAKNCSRELVSGSLLTLTAAISAPGIKVARRNRNNVSPINHFLISVMDQGGFKSNVFARVIKAVLDDFERAHGNDLNLKNYTSAGLQRHQEESCAYGIVTSDEGHKIFTQIRQMEQKGIYINLMMLYFIVYLLVNVVFLSLYQCRCNALFHT